MFSVREIRRSAILPSCARKRKSSAENQYRYTCGQNIRARGSASVMSNRYARRLVPPISIVSMPALRRPHPDELLFTVLVKGKALLGETRISRQPRLEDPEGGRAESTIVLRVSRLHVQPADRAAIRCPSLTIISSETAPSRANVRYEKGFPFSSRVDSLTALPSSKLRTVVVAPLRSMVTPT